MSRAPTSYTVHSQGSSGGNNKGYTAEQIDMLVAYIVAEDAWYVIPVAAFAPRTVLAFYPSGCKKRNSGLYEQISRRLGSDERNTGRSPGTRQRPTHAPWRANLLPAKDKHVSRACTRDHVGADEGVSPLREAIPGPGLSTSYRPGLWSFRPSGFHPARDARSLHSATCEWRRCPSSSRSWAAAKNGPENRPGRA